MKKIKYLLLILLIIPFAAYADELEVIGADFDYNQTDSAILYSNGKLLESFKQFNEDLKINNYDNIKKFNVNSEYGIRYLTNDSKFFDGKDIHENVKDYTYIKNTWYKMDSFYIDNTDKMYYVCSHNYSCSSSFNNYENNSEVFENVKSAIAFGEEKSTLLFLTNNNELYFLGYNYFGTKINSGNDVSTPTKLLENVVDYSSNYALKKIVHYLPNKMDSDLNDIINLLIINYRKDAKDLSVLSKDDPIMIELVKLEQDKIESLITTLKDYVEIVNNDEENEIIDNPDEYTILFDENTCFQDIKQLAKTPYDYENLHTILTNLKKGVLKNPKKYLPIGCEKSVTQLRQYTTRVLIDSLDNNTFYVYYIIHKEETTNGYHSLLRTRVNNYHKNKYSFLKYFYSDDENTKNEYLSKQNDMYNEIIKTIKPVEKVKEKKPGDK